MTEFCIFSISFRFTDNVVNFSVPVFSAFLEICYQLVGASFKIGLLIQGNFLSFQKKSTASWASCVLEKTHWTQIGMSLCSQWSSHSFEVCSGHLEYIRRDCRCLTGTPMWSLDSFHTWSPTQVLQRIMWQMSQ